MARGSIRKRGNKWYYAFDVGYIDGHRKRIERAGGSTRAEAEKALRDALTEYDSVGNVMKLTDMNVEEYFRYWYDNYVMKNLKENTQVNYLNVINKYVVPKLGIYRMKNIGPSALQDFANQLGEMPLAKHSVEIIMTVVKGAFRMAVFPYQLIKENPAHYVQLPRYDQDDRVTRESLKIISMAQYKQILAITPPSDPFNIPLQIAFNTGLRRGEVCGLEWDAVSFEDNTIEVKQNMLQAKNGNYRIGTPKTKSSYRKMLVGESLMEILRAHRKHQLEEKIRYGQFYIDSNFVCTKENGKPVTPNAIKYACYRIEKKLGFPFNFHSLRHTHATMLLENGANIKDIQVRLGHSRIATTMDTYSHVTKKMSTATVNIFEEMLRKNQ
ncbi:phage integrase family site specific recombinase [Secundilactobacillus oryzae JCM 18671]|uniref:Phage integrase family site specific recombinase n=1 Tax=Secundilactobacillus oryzae JCM 18671 TaxID=1291743 RepID=A0A081BI95_9LACO|nr:tyrosine-type recombinase/integrase [Secundilactobacillus oryzae]GAK47763.1 phage integrase family site specific recombinase [Secundilactobacillus oryzae JCM 18671]